MNLEGSESYVQIVLRDKTHLIVIHENEVKIDDELLSDVCVV